MRRMMDARVKPGHDDSIASESVHMTHPSTSPPPRPPLVQAYLLLTIASLAWGGNVVASRLAIGQVSPMVLTSLRWTIVIGIFLALRPHRIAADWRVLKQYWRLGLLMGAIGYTAFSAALYVAAYYTSAVNLAILQGAVPVLVLLGALALHGTRAGTLQVVGVMVTLAGIGVVACRGDLGVLTTLSFNAGDLLILIGGAFYAGYALKLRDRPDLPGLTFFVLMGAGAFVSSLPLVAAEMLMGAAQWPTLKGWGVVLFVAFAPSLVAQLSFMRGVELIGPGRAGIFVNLTPVFGAFLSVTMLGETFGRYHAAALALVLGGILLAEHRALPSWHAGRDRK
jgi:drug/metabolite transporter (DMT)-like permease